MEHSRRRDELLADDGFSHADLRDAARASVDTDECRRGTYPNGAFEVVSIVQDDDIGRSQLIQFEPSSVGDEHGATPIERTRPGLRKARDHCVADDAISRYEDKIDGASGGGGVEPEGHLSQRYRDYARPRPVRYHVSGGARSGGDDGEYAADGAEREELSHYGESERRVVPPAESAGGQTVCFLVNT